MHGEDTGPPDEESESWLESRVFGERLQDPEASGRWTSPLQAEVEREAQVLRADLVEMERTSDLLSQQLARMSTDLKFSSLLIEQLSEQLRRKEAQVVQACVVARELLAHCTAASSTLGLVTLHAGGVPARRSGGSSVGVGGGGGGGESKSAGAQVPPSATAARPAPAAAMAGPAEMTLSHAAADGWRHPSGRAHRPDIQRLEARFARRQACGPPGAGTAPVAPLPVALGPRFDQRGPTGPNAPAGMEALAGQDFKVEGGTRTPPPLAPGHVFKVESGGTVGSAGLRPPVERPWKLFAESLDSE